MIKIKKLKVRLTLFYSSVIIIAIIAIIILVGTVFFQSVQREKIKTVDSQLDSVSQTMDEKIRSVWQIYNSVAINETVKALMIGEGYSDNTRVENMDRELRSYCESGSMISSIVAIDLNNQILHPIYFNELYADSVLENIWFLKMKEENKYNYFSPPVSFPIDTSEYPEDKSTISCYFQFYDNSSYSLLGYMIFNVNKKMFFQDVFNPQFDLFDTFYIMDENNEIIYQTNQSHDDTIMEMAADQTLENNGLSYDSNLLILRTYLSSYPNWKIIGVVDETRMMNDFIKMIVLLVFIGTLCIAIVIGVSAMISNHITKPIFKINIAIKQFEDGSWPPMVICKSEDEIQTLVHGFNNLLIRVNQLVDEIIRKQEDKNKAQLETVKYKLASLQMQINPHFIYNTLNAVSYVAKRNKDQEVMDLMKDLTILLRNSMNFAKDMNSIQEELECLKCYIKIQKSRYGDIFDYQVVKADDIELIPIPKFTLQVLVENAIFHGIAPKSERGLIIIKMKKEEDRILIAVKDNGVGISKDKLDTIWIQKKKEALGEFNNLGLPNIQQRIKLIYGDEYGIMVKSEVNCGTEFIIRIPR